MMLHQQAGSSDITIDETGTRSAARGSLSNKNISILPELSARFRLDTADHRY